MSNNKQSSIDRLAELIRFANKELYAEMFEEFEQAKAMHKQEIEKAFKKGMVTNKTFEDYYNETFGGNND